MGVGALLVAILLALVFLVLPGWLVAWGLGLQGALRVAVAPAFSLGIWAIATWIAIGLQIPWRAWLALPLVALVSLPFLLGRLLTLRAGARAVWPRAPKTALNRSFWISATACGLLSVAPYLWATHFGARVAQTWDVVFHLSAIRFTRESSSASPWEASAPINGKEAYYPNIFHNIVSLLPGSPVTVFEATTAALLLLWPLMMGAFTLQIVVRLRGATFLSFATSGIAMFGASVGANFPTNFVANLATPPYTLALVATPGIIILAVSIYRLRPAKVRYPRSHPEKPTVKDPGRFGGGGLRNSRFSRLRSHMSEALYSSQLTFWLVLGFVVGVAGIVSTHPSSLFNLILILGAPALVILWRAWRGWTVSWPLKFGAPLVFLFAIGIGSWVFVMPRLVSMTKFKNSHQNLWANAWNMFSDYPKSPIDIGFGISGTLFSLAACFGFVMLIRKRRLSWLTCAFALSWIFYLLASGPIWPGYFLTTPWYLQSARLTPLIAMTQLPLAAIAFSVGLERLEAFIATTKRPYGSHWLTSALMVILVVSSLGGSFLGRFLVIEGAYDPQKIVRGTMLTSSEREFIHQQAPALPTNAVIWGAPYQGTPFWWILEGKHVVFPSLSWPGQPALDVIRDLEDGNIGERSCQYLQKLGVTHYYLDSDATAEGAENQTYSWLWWDENVSYRLPDRLLTKVAENNTNPQNLKGFAGQRLYEVNLKSCSD